MKGVKEMLRSEPGESLKSKKSEIDCDGGWLEKGKQRGNGNQNGKYKN